MSRYSALLFTLLLATSGSASAAKLHWSASAESIEPCIRLESALVVREIYIVGSELPDLASWSVHIEASEDLTLLDVQAWGSSSPVDAQWGSFDIELDECSTPNETQWLLKLSVMWSQSLTVPTDISLSFWDLASPPEQLGSLAALRRCDGSSETLETDFEDSQNQEYAGLINAQSLGSGPFSRYLLQAANASTQPAARAEMPINFYWTGPLYPESIDCGSLLGWPIVNRIRFQANWEPNIATLESVLLDPILDQGGWAINWTPAEGSVFVDVFLGGPANALMGTQPCTLVFRAGPDSGDGEVILSELQVDGGPFALELLSEAASLVVGNVATQSLSFSELKQYFGLSDTMR